MAKRFTIELIMDLASRIGANPAKAMSRSNISFLGKGPTKNPLFQNRLAGLENATEANLGKPETLFAAIDDAVGWAKDGKLNSIQTEILGHNLRGIDKIINPPPLPTLPMASVSQLPTRGTGIKSLVPDHSQVPPGQLGKNVIDRRGSFDEMDKLIREGFKDERGRTWFGKLPETGPGNITKALDQKTGMSRAIARQILQQDTRIKLKPEELWKMKLGKGEPLDLMKKYYGKSVMNLDAWLDDFLPRTNLPPRDLATRVLSEVELIPQFASGGLARILEV
jgi:hypothetical protein